jgi:hypothetical protein
MATTGEGHSPALASSTSTLKRHPWASQQQSSPGTLAPSPAAPPPGPTQLLPWLLLLPPHSPSPCPSLPTCSQVVSLLGGVPGGASLVGRVDAMVMDLGVSSMQVGRGEGGGGGGRWGGGRTWQPRTLQGMACGVHMTAACGGEREGVESSGGT